MIKILEIILDILLLVIVVGGIIFFIISWKWFRKEWKNIRREEEKARQPVNFVGVQCKKRCIKG